MSVISDLRKPLGILSLVTGSLLSCSLMACSGDNYGGSVITINTDSKAKIYVYSDQDPTRILDSTSASGGSASLEGLPEGSYTLVALNPSDSLSGAVLEGVKIGKVSQKIQLPLSALNTLRFPLKDSQGNPIVLLRNFLGLAKADSTSWILKIDPRAQQSIFLGSNETLTPALMTLTTDSVSVSWNNITWEFERDFFSQKSSIVDALNGLSYPTSTIAGYEFLAAGLRTEPGIGIIAPFANDDQNLAETYGRLFSAQAYLGSARYKVDSLGVRRQYYPCPVGFDILTKPKMDSILEYLGGPQKAGSRLKSSLGWQNPGNNRSGLSIYPSGYYDGTNHIDFGNNAWIMTSTAADLAGNTVWVLFVPNQGPVEWRIGDLKTHYGIRCLRNK
jgi:uncharacterized protein (TIGR02145 family)